MLAISYRWRFEATFSHLLLPRRLHPSIPSTCFYLLFSKATTSGSGFLRRFGTMDILTSGSSGKTKPGVVGICMAAGSHIQWGVDYTQRLRVSASFTGSVSQTQDSVSFLFLLLFFLSFYFSSSLCDTLRLFGERARHMSHLLFFFGFSLLHSYRFLLLILTLFGLSVSPIHPLRCAWSRWGVCPCLDLERTGGSVCWFQAFVFFITVVLGGFLFLSSLAFTLAGLHLPTEGLATGVLGRAYTHCRT